MAKPPSHSGAPANWDIAPPPAQAAGAKGQVPGQSAPWAASGDGKLIGNWMVNHAYEFKLGEVYGL